MTKEEIYDEKISPLMTQIIAICKEHKIANVCSFSLDLEEGLVCTTAMTEADFEPPDKYKECVKLLYDQGPPPMMVTTRDADGKITKMEAIL